MTLLKAKELVDHMGGLLSMPQVIQRALAEMSRPATNAESLAGVLVQDPPVVGRILHLANSSLYGSRHKILDLTQAIVRIGFQEVKSLLTAVGLSQMLEKTLVLDRREVYLHALTTAHCLPKIERYALRARRTNMEPLFMAALLHDIGLIAMSNAKPAQAQAVYAQARAGEMSLIAAEEAAFECHHGEVGAVLLGQWGFPGREVGCARWHHTPTARGVDYPCETQLLYMSEIFSVAVGVAPSLCFVSEQCDLEVAKNLGIHPRQMETLLGECRRAAQEARAMASLLTETVSS